MADNFDNYSMKVQARVDMPSNKDIDAQIRKLKRLYSNKTKQLCYELEQVFGKNASISTGESVSIVHVKLKSNLSNQEFCKKALQYGIKLIPSYIEEKKDLTKRRKCIQNLQIFLNTAQVIPADRQMINLIAQYPGLFLQNLQQKLFRR